MKSHDLQDDPGSSTDPSSIVRRVAGELGFALVGIAPAEPTAHEGYIRQWLRGNKHGEMAYLQRNLDKRLDPTRFLPGAKAVICVADRHPSKDASPRPQRPGDQPLGRIARYAWADDYHKLIKKRLHRLADSLRQRWPDEQYLSTVDTAPILERDHANRAGLGWIGKHTLLIHPRLGSWLLLGQIITTLELQSIEEGGPTPDHCGTCTRCIDACPTDCIRPYQLDASRCISYLTIEHRGPIADPLQAPMGSWIAGCDICQEVCPFNEGLEHSGSDARKPQKADTPPPIHSRYRPRPPAPAIPLLELLAWDGPARRDAFVGSALKRIKLDQLKRNALIAAGNYLSTHEHDELRKHITHLADDPTEGELVRQTARQVVRRLTRHSPHGPDDHSGLR